MYCSGSHSNPAQQGLSLTKLYGRTMVSKSIYEIRPERAAGPRRIPRGLPEMHSQRHNRTKILSSPLEPQIPRIRLIPQQK